MFFEFLRLYWLQMARSTMFKRKLVSVFVLTLSTIFILLNVLGLGIGLNTIVSRLTGRTDVVSVINSYIIYYFMGEMIYRFFLQKGSSIELEHYLHLPIGRSKIIHYLLFRSFFSPLNIIAILLFGPICWTQISVAYGTNAALGWLLLIVAVSWCIHWVILFLKQKFSGSIIGIICILAVFFAVLGLEWYNWFNLGRKSMPLFVDSLSSFVPSLFAFMICCGLYCSCYLYYRRHAYIDQLAQTSRQCAFDNKITFFNWFGPAGTAADMELKLILRHRKSRQFLLGPLFFLALGFDFYNKGSFKLHTHIPIIAIAIGLFMTGTFSAVFARLFLSWNSSYFDFFLNQSKGIETLVKGKYLLLIGLSLIGYILTIPYVYFGWNVLLVNTAAFLINVGINTPIIIYMALWKPKPMKLNRTAFFNYEGMGLAQFTIGFIMIGLSYVIYLPVIYYTNDLTGLFVLGATGTLGIIFHNKINNFYVRRILSHKYRISSSFRQET